jgi:5-methylcytosine-specific restriction protein A
MPSTIHNPPTREDVEIDGRHMSPARRARILARDDGHCVRPGCETPHDRLQVDHIVALQLGGKDADWNCEVLCFEHHRIKTAADITAIAKAKRRRLKARGEFPASRAKIRSRGFAPTRPLPDER